MIVAGISGRQATVLADMLDDGAAFLPIYGSGGVIPVLDAILSGVRDAVGRLDDQSWICITEVHMED